MKLTDRKSSAFKESRKNKNKKQRIREQTYRKAARKNLTSGETDLVPEALKEQYVPKKQNVEKNPSGVFLSSQRKQKRIIARKRTEALNQGMKTGISSRDRITIARKQSRRIANHQGEIPFVPLALREKAGGLPQPEADRNPGKSNIKIRNQKLAMYAEKSVEMQYQGMVKGKGRKEYNSGSIQSAGLKKGLSVRQKEAEFMAKSVELQGQGTVKGKSQGGQESRVIRKSGQAQKAGLISGLTIRQKESAAMAKSVEGLNQGFTKTGGKGRIQSPNFAQKSREAQDQGTIKGESGRLKETDLMISSRSQSQFQGNIKASGKNDNRSLMNRKSNLAQKSGLISGLTVRQKDAIYMGKSVESQNQGIMKVSGQGNLTSRYSNKSQEALDQGLIKSRSQKSRDQEVKLSSMAHSQYTGELNRKNIRETGKPVELMDQGIIFGRTQKQKDAELLVNSLSQSQYQGEIKRGSKSDQESVYVRKSREAQDQGTLSGKSQKQRIDDMRFQSQIQSQYQGNLKGRMKPEEESKYIKKSHEGLKSGMISGLTVGQKDATYMAKSVEGQDQGLIKGVSTRTIESKYIRKSQEAYDQGLIKGKTAGEMNDEFGKKSLVQSQFRGNLKGTQKAENESKYIRKSNEMLGSGLISGLTIQQKEAAYMAKSVEGQGQGLIKGVSLKTLESNYIRKSIEMYNAGMMKGYNSKSAINEMKKNSVKAGNFQGNYKTLSGTFVFLKDWKDKRNQSKYLKLPAGFTLRAQLFDNIHNLRLSSRQSKFDGMNRESTVERWWAALWKRPGEQRKAPAPLRKPRYDPREHEIWEY